MNATHRFANEDGRDLRRMHDGPQLLSALVVLLALLGACDDSNAREHDDAGADEQVSDPVEHALDAAVSPERAPDGAVESDGRDDGGPVSEHDAAALADAGVGAEDAAVSDAGTLDGGAAEEDAAVADAGTHDAGNVCAMGFDECGVCGGSGRDACGECNGKGPTWWYEDEDRDGLGDPNVALLLCTGKDGFVANADDPLPRCWFSQLNDCGFCSNQASKFRVYDDADDDLRGDPNKFFEVCPGQDWPQGYVSNSNDVEPSCATNDTDMCGLCSGPGDRAWYDDADQDGHGDPARSVRACAQPDGFVANADDPDPLCRTIVGSYWADDQAEIDAIRDVCQVTGWLTFQILGVADIDLPRLTHAQHLSFIGHIGSISFASLVELPLGLSHYQQDSLVRMSFPKLERVSGNVSLFARNAVLEFPLLHTVEGNLDLTFDARATSMEEAFPVLRTVRGGLEITTAPRDVVLPELESAYGLRVDGATHVTAPQLTDVQALHVFGPDVVAVEMGRLEEARGIFVHARSLSNIRFSALRNLEEVSIRSVEDTALSCPMLFPVLSPSASLRLTIELSEALRTVDCRGLATLRSLRVNDNPELERVELSDTESLDALVLFHLPSLTVLSIPELVHARSIDLSRTGLTRLSLPALQHVGEGGAGGLTVRGNPALTSLAMPELSAIDGMLELVDNAQLSACEQARFERQVGRATTVPAEECPAAP